MSSPRRRKYYCCFSIFSLALAFLAATAVGFAQVKSSTINIVAMDPTGARIPDVKADVVEESTNQRFEGQTNNVGELTVLPHQRGIQALYRNRSATWQQSNRRGDGDTAAWTGFAGCGSLGPGRAAPERIVQRPGSDV